MSPRALTVALSVAVMAMSAQAIDCPPTEVPHSDKSQTGIISGSFGDPAIIVTCDGGYTLSGTAQVTCQSTGSWSPLPRCAEAESDEPDVSPNSATCPAAPVTNSVAGLIETAVDSDGKVECISGYGIVAADGSVSDSATVHCNSDEKWEGPLPECTLVCPRTKVLNSVERFIQVAANADATVTCLSGYGESGTAHCGADGAWSGPVPECRSVCPTIALSNTAPEGFTITGKEGDKVTVNCADGYSGGGTAECKSMGQWNLPAECKINVCQPINVANSVQGTFKGVAKTSYPVTCQTGYSGSGEAFCQADGTWASPIPTCKVICAPTRVANSDKSASGSITGVEGDAVYVTCNAGYTGSGYATCGSNGKFSVPTCRKATGKVTGKVTIQSLDAPISAKVASTAGMNGTVIGAMVASIVGVVALAMVMGFAYLRRTRNSMDVLAEDSLYLASSMVPPTCLNPSGASSPSHFALL